MSFGQDVQIGETTQASPNASVLPTPDHPEFFKVIPHIDSSTPLWVQKMYASTPNVYEVDALYHQYYDVHPFRKTIHTQNYKHWRRMIRDIVNEEGFIQPPTPQEEAQRNRLLRQQRNSSSLRSVGSWTSLGPFETYDEGTTTPISWHANIYSIDQSTSNPNVLYAGTEGGGVFKTTDKGLNWTLVSKNEVFAGGLSAIQIHPQDENKVIVAGNSRLYQTSDGGTNWTEIFLLNGTGNEIKYHPTQPDTIFCTSSSGLFRSNDGGVNWVTVFSETCWDIDFHPTQPDSIYLLKSNAALIRSEFFVSGNTGNTWTLKDMGWYTPAEPANASESGGKIAVTAAAPSMVYVGLIGNSKANDDGWIGVYRSLDRGETWVNPVGQDGGPYNSVNVTPWNVAAYTSGYHQGYYNFDLEVSDVNPARIWIATVRLSESSDSAKTFSAIGAANSNRLSLIHADVQDLEVIGNDIWVASDGGINYSNDELQSHDSRKKNIIGADFWGFGSGWNEDVLVGGKYHNGNSAYYQTYGIGNYHNVGGVEEATGYVHPYLNRKSYFNQYWSGGTVSKSIPDALGGSSTSHPMLPKIPNESYVESSSSELLFDPRYGDHIYLGSDSEIFKSTDGGSSFKSLHDFGSGGKVFELKISRSNPDVLYAIYQPNGGYWDWVEIHRSADGGSSWTKLSNVPTNSRWRMEISLNPENENELWVSANSGVNGRKVYVTTDGGSSWQNKTTAQLDGHRIKDIFYQAGTNQVVYVATNNGVFHWDAGTNDWINCSTDLPFVVSALELRPFYRDSKLRLATYGRGIWELNLPQASAPLAQPITKTDFVRCGRDTLQFDCYSVLDHSGASWQWTFSPAPAYISSATARNPKVLLGTEGTYDVTLQVTDGNGNMSSKTITSMVTLSDQCEADTIPGYAVQLNASGDYAQTPDLNLSTNSLTISAWIKPEGIQPDYAGVLMNDGEAAGFNFTQGNNTLGYHWPGGQWWWNSGLIVPANEWSHVAMVATPSSMTIYVNGVASTHNTNLSVTDITTMKIGSYKGWNSRNVKGQIDEVCIWNRSLNIDEIRALRHLTKEDIIPTDPDLVAYYQFNENNGSVLDKVGVAHASLTGGASRVLSSTPVGGGHSSTQVVSSGGAYSFGNTGLTMGFPASGTYPNGQLVVSRINVNPNLLTSQGDYVVDDSYWVVNNYGSNANFSSLDSLTFTQLRTIGTLDIGQTNQFGLFKRASNAESNSWSSVDRPDFIRVAGGEGSFQFSTGLVLNSFSQLVLSDRRGAGLEAKAFLQGPYSSGLMNDDLRSNDLLPSTEPYTALGYVYSNGGGEESFDTSILSTTGNDAIVDWVLIELRDGGDSTVVLYSQAALIQRDGDIVDVDGSSAVKMRQALTGDYFVAILHRNHIGFMSANAFSLSGTATTIDLTTGFSAIHEGNLGATDLGGGVIGMFAGDMDGNGQVQNTDFNALIQQIGTAGYQSADIDMNGQVQNAELQLLLTPNTGRGTQIPD